MAAANSAAAILALERRPGVISVLLADNYCWWQKRIKTRLCFCVCFISA